MDTEAGPIVEPDALEQIRELRGQLEALLRERVPPIITEAANEAKDAMRQAGGYVRDETEAVAAKVRERPLTWLIVAASAGYLLGRITR